MYQGNEVKLGYEEVVNYKYVNGSIHDMQRVMHISTTLELLMMPTLTFLIGDEKIKAINQLLVNIVENIWAKLFSNINFMFGL